MNSSHSGQRDGKFLRSFDFGLRLFFDALFVHLNAFVDTRLRRCAGLRWRRLGFRRRGADGGADSRGEFLAQLMDLLGQRAIFLLQPVEAIENLLQFRSVSCAESIPGNQQNWPAAGI